MGFGDLNEFLRQQRLYFEPNKIYENEDSLVVEMQLHAQELEHQVFEDDKIELDNVIAALVLEKRRDLLSLLAESGVTVNEGGSGASLCINDKRRFTAKIGELAGITARRLGLDANNQGEIPDLVARQIIKEVWPVLCLQQYAKDIEAIYPVSAKIAVRIATIRDRLNEPWKLSAGEVFEHVRLAQKILNDNAILSRRFALSQSNLDRNTFKRELRNLLVEMGEEAPSEASRSWLEGFVPETVRKLASTGARWFLEGALVSPTEREVKDSQFRERFGDRIRELSIQCPLFEDPDPELDRWINKLLEHEAVIHYLDDYSAADEDAHLLEQSVTDQIHSLERSGQCNFSSTPYEEMIRLVLRFSHIADEHRSESASARLIGFIGRKTGYQEKQILELLEELTGQLLPAIRTEFDEAKAHYITVGKTKHQHLLFSTVAACNQWVEQLASLATESTLPPAIARKIGEDLAALRTLQHLMNTELQDIAQPREVVTHEELEELRAERPALTAGQVKREWRQRRIRQIEQPMSESQKILLNCFFLYLQVGTPLLGALAKPVGKMDYNYYLAMMAQAAHHPEATPEGYDYYFAKAQEFWGVDHDFLNQYDLFLRKQMTFSYGPHMPQTAESASSSGLLTSSKHATEAVYEWVRGIAPSSVAEWTAAFLGLTPEGKTAPQLSAWDHWVNSAILPQVRNNYFESVTHYFDQLSNYSGAPSDSPTSQFGFHCYKMYESLKDPSAREAFRDHLAQAESFPQFKTFLDDYTAYLWEHPPVMTARPAVILKFAAEPLTLPSAALMAVQSEPLPPQQRASRLNETQTINILRQTIEGAPLAIHIDDKLLLHILGDSFGRGTGLEGLANTIPLEFLSQLWERKLALLAKELPQATQTEQLDQLGLTTEIQFEAPGEVVPLAQVQRALLLSHKLQGSFETFAHSLKENLEATRPGESVFIPGGWTHKGKGHAIYYEWIRQGDGRFSFRIYNTGEGVQYHPTVTVNFREQAVTFIEQVDIHLEQILRPPALRALQSAAVPPEGSSSTMNDTVKLGADDIYNTILTAMGGRPSSAIYTSDDLRTLQRSGICSMMSLFTLLSYRLEPEQLRTRSQFEWGLKALVDYEQLHRGRLLEGEDLSLNLLSKSLREFARQLIEFRDRAVIHEAEFLYAQQQIARISGTVQAGEGALRAAEKIAIVNVAVPLSESGPSALGGLKPFRKLTKELLPLTTVHLVSPIDSWTPRPETIQKDIFHFEHELTTAYEAGDYNGVLATMTVLMERLPLGVEREFWSRLSWDDSKALIHSLTQIAHKAFESQFRLTELEASKKNRLYPSHFLAQAKLLTLCNQLAGLGMEEGPLIQGAFKDPGNVDLILKGYSLFFRTYNPALDADWLSLGEYWKKPGGIVSTLKELWSGPESLTINEIPWVWHAVRPEMKPSGGRLVDNNAIASDPVAAKLLSHPAVRSAWEAAFPDQPNASDAVVYAWAASDVIQLPDGTNQPNEWSRRIFPQLFYDLRDLSYFNHYLLAYSIDLLPDGQVPRITFLATLDGFESDSSANLRAIVEAPESWFDSQPNLGKSFENAHRTFSNIHLRSLLVRSSDSSFPEATLRINQDEQLWKFPTHLPNLSLQQQRAIMSLSSKKEVQVRETLAFFMKNSHLLSNPDYQMIFNLLLFAPGRLLSELAESPKDANMMVGRVTAFFNNQFRTCRKLGDWQTAAYFLHAARLFKRYVDYGVTHQGVTLSFQPAFIDTRSEVRSMLAEEPPPDARALLDLQLALTYEGEPPSSHTLEELTEIIAAAISCRLKVRDASVLPAEQLLAADALLEDHRERLAALTSGPERDALLNGVMAKIKGETSPQAWKPHITFPLFLSEDGLYAIDVVKCTFYERDSALSLLRNDTINHRDFIRALGADFHPTVLRLSSSLAEFTGPDGMLYRVEEGPGGPPVLQRYFNEANPPSWYQLTQPVWDSHDELKRIPDALQLGVHWYRPGAPAEMLICKKAAGPPVYLATLSEDLTRIETVQRLGEKEPLFLADTNPDMMSGLDEDKWMLSWVNQKGDLSLFEVPRFDLEFHVDGGKFFCKQFPGYFLAARQVMPPRGVRSFYYFKLLENDAGQQKVLLPKGQIVNGGAKVFKSPLQTSHLNLAGDQKEPTQTYFEYDVDKESGKLVPRSESGRFYLATIFLRQMDYAQAHAYLRGLESSLRPFEPSEVALLSDLLLLAEEGDDKKHDNDPRALSAYLYAMYLLQRNKANFPNAPNDEVKYPRSLMQRYLNVIDHMGDFVLKPEEEIFLLTKNMSSMAQQHRLRYLTDGGASSSQQPLFAEKPIATFPALTYLSDRALLKEEDSLSGLKQASRDIAFLGQETGTVLRAPAPALWMPFYRLVRGELNDADANKVYKAITGISQLPNAPEERREDLKQALNIMRNGVSSKFEAAYLLALQIVLDYPDEFPEGNRMQSLGEKRFQTRVREAALKLLDRGAPVAVPEPLKRPAKVTLSPSESAWPQKHTVALPYQLCVAPYASSTLSKPLLPELSNYLTMTPMPTEDLDQLSNELTTLFGSSVEDRVVQKEFNRVKADLTKYHARKAEAPTPNHYAIADMDGFIGLRKKLDQQIIQGELSFTAREEALLSLANKGHAEELSEAVRLTEQIVQDQGLIDPDRLIHLFLKRDMEGFHKANSALTVEDIHSLNHEVMEYLIQSTHLQHLRRLSKKIADIQQAVDKGVPAGQMSEMLEELSNHAIAKRVYNVEEQPAYLVLEHYMNILLRNDQKTNLDLLRIEGGRIGNPDKIGVVLESIPGSGKTEVLLPILGQLCANGENLCFGVLPESLLPDMSQTLSRILGSSYKQLVEVLVFTREQELTVDDLRLLLLRLNHAVSDRRMVFSGSTSIQSLYLKMIESWRSYSQNPTESNQEEFDLFRAIFRLLYEKGVAIIDEADVILNARKELHFTLGTPVKIPTHEVESVCHLFQMLFDPAIVPDMRFDFGSAVEGAPAFTPERYQEIMTQRLVDKHLDSFLGSSDSEIRAYLEGLNPEQKGYLHTYLSRGKDADSQAFVEQIADERIRDLLSLGREWIHVLLPLTANKLMGVNYGASKRPEVLVSIPYHGSNNPSENSRYGIYETLNYTLQRLLKNGITGEIVRQEIEKLQAEAFQRVAQNKEVEGTAAYERFLELTNGDPRIRLFEAHQWADTIAERINSSPELQMEFIRRYAISQIQNYPLTLSANSQLFNFLFGKTIGFTGTLWNDKTFPTKLEVFSSDIATARTLELLWKNSGDKVHVVPVIESSKLAFIFNDIPELPEAHAFIDASGVGRGIPNCDHKGLRVGIFTPGQIGV